jgi:opacity protein-like surface antigen
MAAGKRLLVTTVLLLGLSAPAPAAAEWFLDFYGGQSWTRDTDIRIRGIDIAGVDVQARLQDVRTEDSLLLGARFGHWFGFLPVVGLAVDAFHFQPDIPAQTVFATGAFTARIFDQVITATAAGPVRIPSADVHAVVVSADLMLRLPLFSEPDYPHGRLQPYLTAGPAGLLTDPEDLGVAVGFKVGAGLAWQITGHVAIFGEYRYTHFRPEVESGGIRYRARLETNHALIGLSLRF